MKFRNVDISLKLLRNFGRMVSINMTNDKSDDDWFLTVITR